MIGFYAAGAMGAGSGPATGPVLSITPSSSLNGSSATKNVQMPATVAVGDMLVIIFRARNSAAISAPSGWTAGPTVTNSGVRNSVFYREADGTEGGTTVPVVAGGTVASASLTYRIAASAVRSPVQLEGDTWTTLDPPSLSPSWGSADTIWIAMAGCNSTSSPSAYPYADGNTFVSSGGSNPTAVATSWDQITASSENPGAFTWTASAPNAMTLAVRPP